MFRNYFGEVEDSVVMRDKDTGRPREFGFSDFQSEDTADKALENFDSNYINGKWWNGKKPLPGRCSPWLSILGAPCLIG